ncbi:MAG: hypothetical protein VKK05_09450, partial [Synechococcus sp.]|nr:hypothetical protein [Synechococcus sp.]
MIQSPRSRISRSLFRRDQGLPGLVPLRRLAGGLGVRASALLTTLQPARLDNDLDGYPVKPEGPADGEPK